MVVDPSKAFTRTSWNEDIIREVNELCVNPDTGCDPLETLDEAEADHIWAKTDVTEVQDKLVEICPDNEFEDLNTPQLWHYNYIIVPIEEAIRRGWCGCTPTETEYDFGYFPQRTLEAATNEGKGTPTVEVNPTGCGGFETITYSSTFYPVPSDNEAIENIRIGASIALNAASGAYRSGSYFTFYREDIVEGIEDEITVLESEITAIEDDITDKEAEIIEAITLRDYYCAEGPPSECTTYTTLVTTLESDLAGLEDDLQVKEGELEVKETELDAAEAALSEQMAERDTARAEYDAAAQIQWAAYQALELRYSTDIQPVRDLFPEMDEPWGDYWEDTRALVKGKWYFDIDLHDDGTAETIVGDFSPGGYPYYIGPSAKIYLIENTCRYYEYTYFRDCVCPWEYINRGTERCEGTKRIWWKFTALLDIDCANVEDHDWGLSFRIKESPDYTRPPPE